MKEKGLVHVFVPGLEDVMNEMDGITPSLLILDDLQHEVAQTTKSATTQSDVLSEMERIREMFKTPENPEERQRHQSGPGSLYYTEKPEERWRHHSGPGSFHYIEKPKKPLKRPPQSSGYYSQTTSRQPPKGFPPRTPVRPSQFGQKPRRLVTDVKDWS